MVKNTLTHLTMYQGEENAEALEKTIRQISTLKTWGGMKGFIHLLEDRDVRDFMLYPIRFIENTSADALLPEGKPNWKVVNGFKKDFTRENGAFRWPVSDDTELTRKHLGAIRAICSHPNYGRLMWDAHDFVSHLNKKKDSTALVGMWA